MSLATDEGIALKEIPHLLEEKNKLLEKQNELLESILKEIQITTGTRDKDAILKLFESFKPEYSYYPNDSRDPDKFLKRKKMKK